MPKNIFKIYDGRTSFWQWDTKQKLIVLDENVTMVHFSNRNMTHSIPREIYIKDGLRLCNIPDDLLKIPKNLVAYAYVGDLIIKSVKFAVMQRPMPRDYISNQTEDIEEKFTQIDVMLETLNENKADNICVDENGNIQLTSNGELIGNIIELPDDEKCCIADCVINDDGHLIVTLTDGTIIDAGYVGINGGVTFVPHISEDNILTWTNNGGLENPEPVDLNPFDEWSTLPEEGIDTEYEWSYL